MLNRLATFRFHMLLCCILLCVAGVTRAAQFQVGVCTHVGTGKHPLAGTKSALINGGFNSLRDELTWGSVELTRGRLIYPAGATPLDQLISDHASRGGRPILVLDYANKNYDRGDMVTYMTSDSIDGYVRYANFMVSHFAGRIDQFEIWNEWNSGLGSSASPKPRGSAEDYVRLLKPTYASIKAAHPSVTVIGGAVSWADDKWIDEFGNAGGFAHLDAFSIHPYVYWNRSSAPLAPVIKTVSWLRDIEYGIKAMLTGSGSAVAQTAFTNPAPRTPEKSIANLDRLKAKIDGFAPGRNLPIYITEVGWPTHTEKDGLPEESVAAFIQRFYLLARTRPWIAGVWWYDLFDDGDDPAKGENRFGLMRRDVTAKPAFTALVAIKDVLRAKAVPTIKIVDQVAVLTTTLDDGRSVKVAWLTTDNFDVWLDWPEGTTLLNGGYKAQLSAAQRAAGATEKKLSAIPMVLIKG